MPMDAVESAKALIEAKAAVDATDRDRRTPLHWASEKTAEQCLRLLLEHGAAVDTVDWGGYSALHSAAKVGSLACISVLLEKGANPELVALNGETPLDLTEDADVMKALAPPPSAEPSLKRKRTLSTGTAALEASLPMLADSFYKVAASGDLAAVRKLCTPDMARTAAQQVASVLAAKVRVGEMHTCTRTMTVHAELRIGTSKVLHHLRFTDDGLIATSELFTEMMDVSPSLLPTSPKSEGMPPSG